MSGVGDALHHPTACGCGRCLGKTRLEVEQDAMGEQAPSAEEVELLYLRRRVVELHDEVARARARLRAGGLDE